MAYTYDDFLAAAGSSGLLGEFSRADLDTAMKYPEFGLSILSLKKDFRDATTDEQRLLANEAANQLRSSYGNYMGGGDGGSFYSQGKIPGQIDSVLDQIDGFGSFSFDQEAPVYDNKYAEQQQALLDAILNREDFSWNKEDDPQWSSYKKSYLREGDRATQNALAQASAASGGRASTAAVTAASQAGDYYASKLNDIIPTLYQQAYDRYLNEYSMMLQDLGAVNTQEQLDYAKYLDQVSQYNTDRNFAYNQYLGDFDILQGKLSSLQGQDAVDYNRVWDEAEREYGREMDRAALLASVGDYSGYAALMGLSESQTKALVGQFAKEQGLSDREAAMELANFFAEFGDYSKAEEMGVDTSYMETLKRLELAGATAGGSGSSGGGGNGGRGDGGDPDPGVSSINDLVTAFQAGDHSDATIKALLDAGYTQADLEASGYTGNYFKMNYTPSEAVQSQIRSLELMRGQTGSETAIANSIVVLGETGRISMDDAEYMLGYFGYDPKDYIDYD
ncbi:hypothetical protein [uncultured Flavonifractor sp.]|uniref:hypothetical protein n=1 Tax=uncultured Flavonifractor sp. TaxID=1193534 RepID=UPI0026082EAC|nr:hypothetical protein [uncultured Flavonifractor sp.]